METLIDQLFIKSQADAIRTLWEDTSSRALIRKEIGKQLLSHELIIKELPLTQLMLTASLSSFADSENECCEIAGIIYWGIKTVDIIPMVSKHNGRELAYRCLISLGFFKQYLIKRCERYGAPSPSFYRQAGINSFNSIGMNDIGYHFLQWENLISELFI